VVNLLKIADLGIINLNVEVEEFSEDYRPLFEAIKKMVKSKKTDFDIDIPLTQPRVRLVHAIQGLSVPFQLEDESEGTRAFFSLLGPVLAALTNGDVVCIDELDTSLHPLLAVELVRLFNDRNHNQHGAQIIFNTHDTNLLSSSILRRDQIWFTEKGKDATSHLYPLSDFKPRRSENLEQGYLQGRYGAIPFLNSAAFIESIEGHDGTG
jgi:AAA15 family ATPase/GTPase